MSHRSNLAGFPILALACALLGTGACAQEAPRAPIRFHPEPVEALHDRIQRVRVERLPLGAYHLAKAQAWTEAAADAYHLGERGVGMRTSLDEADRLLQRLEARDVAIPTGTPRIAGASPVREDLWQQAGRLKAHPGFVCAQRETARFEVMLAMAGHFDARSGWREARSYVQAAERLGREAQHRIDGCEAAQAADPGGPEREAEDRSENR